MLKKILLVPFLILCSLSPGFAAVDIYELQARAEAGNPEAQFTLGRMYETGEDAYVDYYESARWY